MWRAFERASGPGCRSAWPRPASRSPWHVLVYGRTPSGFDFRSVPAARGSNRRVAPADDDVTSVWGHKPKLGLQLRMAKELVVRGLGS